MMKNNHDDHWKTSVSIDNFRARASLLKSIRQFFDDRGVLEVETPLLGTATSTHPYIQAITASLRSGINKENYFLQTSPEYAMKRLLAGGIGPIYQICKSFRDEEVGRFHNPEFTMLEWYRPGFDHHQLMDEVEDFLMHTLGVNGSDRVSYEDLFLQYLNINPHLATIEELQQLSLKNNIDVTSHDLHRDDYLNLLMTHYIEPKIGFEKPLMIYHYPVTQSALAKVVATHHYAYAERFEVYVRGVEIANGYHELTDPNEQLARFNQDCESRKALGLPELPVDTRLISALQHGLPDSAGIALGVDRLLMVKLNCKDIKDIMSFTIEKV